MDGLYENRASENTYKNPPAALPLFHIFWHIAKTGQIIFPS
jgi:hypothetical protein